MTQRGICESSLKNRGVLVPNAIEQKPTKVNTNEDELRRGEGRVQGGERPVNFVSVLVPASSYPRPRTSRHALLAPPRATSSGPGRRIEIAARVPGACRAPLACPAYLVTVR